MKVLITGATGFVGTEIVRQLRGSSFEVRCLVRNPRSQSAQKLVKDFSAELCQGDITNASSLKAAMREMDAIIHLVGIISEFGQSTFENIHILGTENTVKAAREHGPARYIHMSALGTRAEAISRYHESKYAAEEFVRQSGLNFTIFRPSLIFGPRDEFVNLFAKIARLSPIFPMMNYNHARFSPVSVEVVARAFTMALTEPKSIGKTFDLCGMDTFEMPQLLDMIFTVLGRKRLKVHIPFSVAKAQARVLEFVYPNLFRKPPPFSRDQLIMLCEDNTGDPNTANDLFQLPQIGFEEGIARYLKSKR